MGEPCKNMHLEENQISLSSETLLLQVNQQCLSQEKISSEHQPVNAKEDSGCVSESGQTEMDSTEFEGVSRNSNVENTFLHNQTSADAEHLQENVYSSLRAVSSTEISVHNCAYTLQKLYGSDSQLRRQCLEALANFFLTVDNQSQCNAFYVLNDLVQYDSRFRRDTLEIVLPRLAYTISGSVNVDVYAKTVNVWQHRKIFPPRVCNLLQQAFTVAKLHKQNTLQFEQRLAALVEIMKIRSLKDEETQRSFDDSQEYGIATKKANENTKTTTGILSASNVELESMSRASQSALQITQDTINYISRLLSDFNDIYSTSNTMLMQELLAMVRSTTRHS